MANKLYDIIVFGATGYTGKNVVQYVARSAQEVGNIKWAISGRDESKLRKVLSQVPAELVNKDVGIIVCDVNDELSLLEMANQGIVVLNCVGPYRFSGDAVVKACIAKNTHHIDVSGEPQFLETMQLRYHKEAKEKGVYVVGACGFDSVPSDVGVSLVHKAMSGPVNSIETYLELGNTCEKRGAEVNFATWQSAIYGFAHADELKGIRKKLFPERLPRLEPKQKDRGALHQTEEVGDSKSTWCLKFPGSDRTVMLRSERYRYELEKKRPSQIQAYVQFSSLFMSLLTMFIGAIFGLFASFKFGRYLLEKYPGFFSLGYVTKAGPPKEIAEGSYFKMTIKGLGWKDYDDNADNVIKDPYNREVTVVAQSKNVGYGATCEYMVQSALTILQEIESLPGKGGVFTPGYAFANSSIVERLNNKGCSFDVSVKDI